MAILTPLALLAVYSVTLSACIGGPFCNSTPKLATATILFGSIVSVVAAAGALLHFGAKVKWLAAIESVIITLVLLYVEFAVSNVLLGSGEIVYALFVAITLPLVLIELVSIAEWKPIFLHIATIPILILLMSLPTLVMSAIGIVYG